jgi:transposase
MTDPEAAGVTPSRQELENRHMQALEGFRNGWRQASVARLLGVSRTSASRWYKAWKAGSDMKSTQAPGRPRRLTPRQLAEVEKLIRREPEMTHSNLAVWIRKRYGVEYHRDHAGRIKNVLLGRSATLASRVG